MTEDWADDWRGGYGPIRREPVTSSRWGLLAERLVSRGVWPDTDSVYRVLAAADRLSRAALWLVAHMTYARQVDLSGAPLPAEAFKDEPAGHAGGSLTMVPAFVGYLAANVLSGATRGWVTGQGHCAAAIEAVNALTGDDSVPQQGRYGASEAELSELVADDNRYGLRPDGRPSKPRARDLSARAAGAMCEDGYPTVELQYVHMPLPGESLVAFMSDEALERQGERDRSPRWWRAEDSGLVTPVMICNGRRLDERSEIKPNGGATWLERHLALSGFEPMIIDGHDPAAYAWAILEAEERLKRFIANPSRRYPAPLPYVIARAVAGYGFPGAGTRRAHDLTRARNPRKDAAARAAFNAAAAALFVPERELACAIDVMQTHELQHRERESRHPVGRRRPPRPQLPRSGWTSVEASPTDAVDRWFNAFVGVNSTLRPRIASPQVLPSHRMRRTFDHLKRRVNFPRLGAPEAVDGAVIAELGEEAALAVALGNRGGLNLIVSDEACAVKMLGGLRREIISARRQAEASAPAGWISIPLIATSHIWEESQTEPSHQDPTLAETLLGEMADVSRVLFPIDANSAIAALASVYATRGQIACLVIPNRVLPARLDGPAAEALAHRGWAHLVGDPAEADVQIVAVGAYQAQQALQAGARLRNRGRTPCVTAIVEPGRLRTPRDDIEACAVAKAIDLSAAFPPEVPRVLVTHTRPEPMQGLLRRIDPGPDQMISLGYISRGGSLDAFGMLFANRSTWAHVVEAAAKVAALELRNLLEPAELCAIAGQSDPHALRGPR